MEQSPGKYLPSGLVLVECPDQVKTSGSHTISVSSVTEYLQALSKSWSVKSFVTSLARIIKDIKLTSNISTNQKESSNIPCTVRHFSSFSTALIQGTHKTIAACLACSVYAIRYDNLRTIFVILYDLLLCRHVTLCYFH